MTRASVDTVDPLKGVPVPSPSQEEDVTPENPRATVATDHRTLSPGGAMVVTKLMEMQLRQVCEDFAATAKRLGDSARLIALLEAQLGSMEGQAGWHRPGPSRREFAAELVLGELAPLRPHLPFASEESVERARRVLRDGDE
jgi:hypothetical protein